MTANNPSAVESHAGRLAHVDDYLALGQRAGASDIHLGVNAPPIWRLQGVLQPIWADAPKLTAEDTAALTESFLPKPQRAPLTERGDAEFAYATAFGRFRTSVVRQRLGTDLVFRIINTQVRTMDELGLPEHLKLLTRYQNGLILVTGSVGSGKSTTLAALVEQVNIERREHIITLEDPIEYIFEPKNCHITQREVHTHTASFGAALRGALREDPDVIMIGEMRDLETCRIAIQSALTGHLVLSTLHTNSAAGGITRLLDMGVEDYLLGSTINGILAQRLVRRLDPETAIAYEALPEVIAQFELEKYTDERPIRLWKPGTSTANPSGYRGRRAIMEFLTMTDPLRRLVMQRADAGEIEKQARAEG
ncbi:MAG: Flp pilus assembly complex ATPase component TadA, partial [Verrucomicrobiota bacterium]|nr:Flp pilus assembly complex ATPase component TadA [Verrucomicrobiota bacterium]